MSYKFLALVLSAAVLTVNLSQAVFSPGKRTANLLGSKVNVRSELIVDSELVIGSEFILGSELIIDSELNIGSELVR